ncbi:KH domain protein [Ancylostoma caninum]|uniref:KH domain protein n=1 Tax=Ancylostoma caninum TaxID=29170 RepID=A0A368EVI7_ANCCA|nr:KH domain protein [Ancylostoma caninum]
MSKSSETYPGTSERICLVKGRVQNVIGVIDVILQKIREKCEGSTSSDAFDHKGVSRGNEVKIVMPNTSAGMVIGKSGANIKDIRETYGCQIQVFPKAGSTEAQNSLERIVTLAHEDHSRGFGRVQTSFGRGPTNTGQPRMPQHGRDRMSGVEGDQATVAPLLRIIYNIIIFLTLGGKDSSGGFVEKTALCCGETFVRGCLVRDSMLEDGELLSFLDNLQSTLRSSGFNEASVAEVMQAMQVLAKYNIMGLGLGLGVAAMAQMRSAQETTPQMPSNHGVAGFGDQGGYASGDQVGRFQSQGVQIRWQ